MSKLSQELQVLFFLNEEYKRNKYTKLSEIINYLDLDQKSSRQVRRYLNDLEMAGFYLDTKRGENGGYKLLSQLPSAVLFAPNIALAMFISMKSDAKLETILKELPKFVDTNFNENESFISANTLSNLDKIIYAIRISKELDFNYRNFNNRIRCNPYKIIYTNNSYYLYAENEGKIKTYDVLFMKDIKYGSIFIKNNKILEKLASSSNMYGIKWSKDGTYTTLKVKCLNDDAIAKFKKYFENKGSFTGKIFEISSTSENELFYPLFRISTKDYEILNDDFKRKYIQYLENYLKYIKRK